MYTIQSAAWVLGVPTTTVRRWIEQAGIEKVLIEADRVRNYIADIDVLMLSDKHCRKLGKLEKITRRKDDDQDKDLYTLSEVAKFLDVTINTVRKWLLEADIEKKYIVTDKRRVYVSFYDVLVLVNMHRRVEKQYSCLTKCFDEKQRENGLYSLKEAARILGVSYDTTIGWIKKYNIDREINHNDRQSVYMQDCVLMMLD